MNKYIYFLYSVAFGATCVAALIFAGSIINDLLTEDEYLYDTYMMPSSYDEEYEVRLADALEHDTWEVLGNIYENPELINQ